MSTGKDRINNLVVRSLNVTSDFQIEKTQVIYIPERNASPTTAGNFYGVKFDLSNFLVGTTASHCYGVMINGDRPSTAAATGDANDAYLRISGNNYGANDTNYIYRGLNVAVNNRSGGTLGVMENLISIQGRVGGTTPTLRGLTVKAENYGTCATEMGAADFIMANEGAAPTLSYGISIRNDERSTMGAVGSAVLIKSHASSSGFTRLINAEDAVLAEYDTGTKVCLMSFKGANGTTYYLLHDTDSATVLSVNTSLA